MADYEFRYSPLTGRLTGKQMIEQTEQAINQLSSLVDSAAGQVEIISTLANEANENAANALETAEEALATTGRTYITVSGQADANIYYDSQLIYIADSTSTNIPVADTGMLEVKTNDNKTACEQVFIADSSGDAYYRNGDITAETVGDVTTYTVTWGGWSSQPASQTYVQGELANYLPLSGGTVTGDLTVSGNIAGNLTGNVAGNASENLPLTGGTMVGDIDFYDNLFLGTPVDVVDPSKKSIFSGLYSNKNNPHKYGGVSFINELTGTARPQFNISAGDGTHRVFLVGFGDDDPCLTFNSIAISVSAVGSNYIRYDNGVQICWGRTVNFTTAGTYTVTLPVAFANADYKVVMGRYWIVNQENYYFNNDRTTTTFQFVVNGNVGTNGRAYDYIAVGKWK